jgi:hypothetical protein
MDIKRLVRGIFSFLAGKPVRTASPEALQKR